MNRIGPSYHRQTTLSNDLAKRTPSPGIPIPIKTSFFVTSSTPLLRQEERSPSHLPVCLALDLGSAPLVQSLGLDHLSQPRLDLGSPSQSLSSSVAISSSKGWSTGASPSSILFEIQSRNGLQSQGHSEDSESSYFLPQDGHDVVPSKKSYILPPAIPIPAPRCQTAHHFQALRRPIAPACMRADSEPTLTSNQPFREVIIGFGSHKEVRTREIDDTQELCRQNTTKIKAPLKRENQKTSEIKKKEDDLSALNVQQNQSRLHEKNLSAQPLTKKDERMLAPPQGMDTKIYKKEELQFALDNLHLS